MIGIVWFPKGFGSILWARHFQTPYPVVSFLFYRYPLEVCPGVISTGTASSHWFLCTVLYMYNGPLKTQGDVAAHVRSRVICLQPFKKTVEQTTAEV